MAVIAGAARHANYLRNHHHFGGNHLITEMMALASIAVVWPEFSDSEEWLSYAVERSLEEMDRQVYPDGAHKELANHYQWIAGSSFQRLYSLLIAAGATEAAEQMRPRMEKIWDYYAWVTRPNGTGPLNNDSDLEPNADQLVGLAEFYDREDWLYIASKGEEGERPSGTPSRVFPWAGHVVLRTDWGSEGDWVFFDCGPFGTDHQQRDQLHLSASLDGRNFLVDSGRYVYRDDPWAEYFRGPRAHNVPTFDRFDRIVPDPEAREPQKDLLDQSGELRIATGSIPLRDSVTGIWSGEHSRTVALGEGFVWIVDQVDLSRPDEITFRWHFDPELVLESVGSEWEIKADELGVGRWTTASSVHFEVEEIAGRERGEIQGWYSPEYNERVPNSVLEYRSAPTSIARVAWLLVSEERDLGEAEIFFEGDEAILRFGGEGVDERSYSIVPQ